MVGDKDGIFQGHDGDRELILDGSHGRRGRRRGRGGGQIVAVGRRVVALTVLRSETAEHHRQVDQTVEKSEEHHPEEQLS